MEVAVIGGGAAGIAAARRLHEAGVSYLLVEARARLGGRAYTVPGPGGAAVDLGCGWLHSGDRNPWTAIAEASGWEVDRSDAPWQRPALSVNFPPADQDAFGQASEAFYQRLETAGPADPDVALSALVEPRERWTPLLDAVSTYVSGAELDRVSARDLWNYADTGVNWRVRGGYGAMIAAHAEGLNVRLDCAVRGIDHSGKRLRIETTRGNLMADRAIITLPSRLIAEEAVTFTPALPDKADAARGLPLGLADKLYLTLPDSEGFDVDCRALGRTDSAATATYNFRPMGKPQIECYFAGANAADLERGGQAAFLDFARGELTGLFGADFARRAGFIGLHMWGSDPWSGGSYSYARPGCAGQRQVLAAPVEDRLFFAGEACSEHDYSTAHGAYRTGVAAAEAALAGRGSAGF